jgi:hypothetical protein
MSPLNLHENLNCRNSGLVFYQLWTCGCIDQPIIYLDNTFLTSSIFIDIHQYSFIKNLI